MVTKLGQVLFKSELCLPLHTSHSTIGGGLRALLEVKLFGLSAVFSGILEVENQGVVNRNNQHCQDGRKGQTKHDRDRH